MTAGSDAPLQLHGLPEDVIGQPPSPAPHTRPPAHSLACLQPLLRAHPLHSLRSSAARILQYVDSSLMLLTVNRLSSAFKQHTDEPQSAATRRTHTSGGHANSQPASQQLNSLPLPCALLTVRSLSCWSVVSMSSMASRSLPAAHSLVAPQLASARQPQRGSLDPSPLAAAAA